MSKITKIPAVLAVGKGISLKGKVLSNYTITSVTAKIMSNSTGKKVSGRTAATRTNSYGLSALNKDVAFSKLKAGSYTYILMATDKYPIVNRPLQVTKFKVGTVPVRVSRISVSPKTVSVVAGSKVTLKVTFTPSNATNKTVFWMSANTSIANVSEGVVSGIKAGTAIITAVSADGVKTATATVTVTAAPKPPAGCETLSQAENADDQFPIKFTAGKGTLSAFLQVAGSQKGYHEGTYKGAKNCSGVYFPGDKNWSKYGFYMGFPASMKGDQAYSWCAAFVSWSARKAGIPTSKIPNYTYVPAGWNSYRSKKRLNIIDRKHPTIPKPGDLVFYWEGGSEHHTGIVVSANSASFSTIEGNSGNRVMTHQYSYQYSKLYAFGSNS